ncbi:MAG: class I SAM-dependent rRNA methyltransferase [Bacteroidota bacterium]
MIKDFSTSTPERIAVKVNKAAERMIRKQHPWVFESAITKQSKAGKVGDLAIIYDQKNNKLLAIGLYDPDSPIRIKLLQFRQKANINTAWFRAKIQEAYHKRAMLLATETNSYRFIYGENDGLPALIVDVYDKVLVIKIYARIWLPYLNVILPLLLEISTCETAVFRLSRNVQKVVSNLDDGEVVYGNLVNEDVIFSEHGLRFSANVVKGHKTGYFLDHRHNRKKIGTLAKDKSVLDIFAYAGGFSVHALAGGAKRVVSLDISAQALAMATKNAALNNLTAKHETMAVDAFEGMQKLTRKREKFDIVIVDPPAFAKREKEVEKALYSYARLVKLAIPLIQKNGILLMCSCSSRVKSDVFFDLITATLQKSNRSFRVLERTLHDVDHPIGFPEGAYLKSIYFRLL